MKCPDSVKACLWSYDTRKMDTKDPRDKREIITQVLNEGNFEALEWLCKTYSLKDIKEVIKHPKRGTWFKKSLQYWLKILDIDLVKQIYKEAIFNLNPQF